MEEKFKKRFQLLDQLGSEDILDEAARKRGLDFEKLINDILLHEKVLIRPGYHTSDNRAEQIDGAAEISGRIYLLEMKWVSSNIAASELYAFIGKIENKFHGTLGIFISRNKLTDNFLDALNKGRRQSIVVIHGDDIDQIFKNKFSFKDYIAHVTKVLSYDNRVHFSVKEYLELQKTEKPNDEELRGQAIQSKSTEAIAYIKQSLLKSPIDENTFQLELAATDVAILDLVFEYVLRTYDKVAKESFKRLDFTTRTNYRTFIDSYTPTKKVFDEVTIKYYNEWLSENFEQYANEIFISKFGSNYNALSNADRQQFEQLTMAKFSKHFGEYNIENAITELLRPNWAFISSETKYKLYEFYLDIFISDRKDKFAQKAFSNELMTSAQIEKQRILIWLENKIKKMSIQFHGGDVAEQARFIASTYHPVAKYLNLTTKDWLNFITVEYEKIRNL